MTKKGLSLEAKREKVLEIFHADDDVFQLKEIEKLAAAKGVTAQSVKDVVQSLVDDDLVHQDKIGIANFLWAFAAEASTKVKVEEGKHKAAMERVEALYAEMQGQIKACRAETRALQSADEDSALRAQLMGDLETYRSKCSDLKVEKDKLAVVDEDRFKAMQEAAVIARDSANRWLDNIHALHDWCRKSFQGREADVDKFFEENGLTDSLDYVN